MPPRGEEASVFLFFRISGGPQQKKFHSGRSRKDEYPRVSGQGGPGQVRRGRSQGEGGGYTGGGGSHRERVRDTRRRQGPDPRGRPGEGRRHQAGQDSGGGEGVRQADHRDDPGYPPDGAAGEEGETGPRGASG